MRFDLGDGELLFVDPRRFGTGELALGHDALDAFFAARLGVEPFEPRVHRRAPARARQRCRAPIKAFLLDQKRIAGVGNIYADEALFRARVHPLRRADQLTPQQCEALRDGVVASLQAGIAAKGATIDDFRDPDGVSGTFQDRSSSTCARASRARAAGARCASCAPRGAGPTCARTASRGRGLSGGVGGELGQGARRGRPARAPDSRRAARRR